MEENKKYWKSFDTSGREGQLQPDSGGDQPVPDENSPVDNLNRRTFLKLAGFSVAGSAIVAGCSRAPMDNAVPYMNQPEEVIPGRGYTYASTCAACSARCGILVSNRDGRPVKIEGNPDHPISKGGLCPVGQASLLGVYDSKRLQGPQINGSAANWADVDSGINSKLNEIRANGGKVRVLSHTINSPSTQKAIDDFLSTFDDTQHVMYDALSCSAILDAHELTHQTRAMPHCDFAKAKNIVSFDADFLATWISPVEFTKAYTSGRSLENGAHNYSHHTQFEGRLSLTGSRADKRVRIKPAETGAVVSKLASLVAEYAGEHYRHQGGTLPVDIHLLEELAGKLWQGRGQSLVITGSQDVNVQTLCNYINHLCGNYGSTIHLDNPSLQCQGSDRDLLKMSDELESKSIDALVLLGVNPVYDLPNGDVIADGLKNTALVVSVGSHPDETSELAGFVCPEPHFLEAWNDYEPVNGLFSLGQPAIQQLGNQRHAIESLASWSGQANKAYDAIRSGWREQIFPHQSAHSSFDKFWNVTLHDGVSAVTMNPRQVSAFNRNAVKAPTAEPRAVENGFELQVIASSSMLNGEHGNNPFLHELPDPISKVVWDNYASLSPDAAERLGVEEGDVVNLNTGSKSIDLPAFIQPGQHNQVVAVAFGYGQSGSARFGDIGPEWIQGKPTVGDNGLIGTNVAPLMSLDDNGLAFTRSGVILTPTGRKHYIATTQRYDFISVPEKLRPPGAGVRAIIMETTLPDYQHDPSSGIHTPHHPDAQLWPDDHPYEGYHWAMAVDLNKCTGCSSCVVACQVENNIPVVGKDEVSRGRIMHWMRIDRYYAGPHQSLPQGDDVDVVHQPMFCQHCDNAPCETVCPVLATVHSSEGLNQQIYNRCVGTRYCSNNCPYKTRRFNFFDYKRVDDSQNLMLNPNVTVRSRGIMEKCSLCVHRIQEAKINAKGRGEPLKDGDIQPACQQTCPAGAIVFGDSNDPESEVSKLMHCPRAYRVLEEINVRPSVSYLSLVRNRDASGGGYHG